MVSIIEHARTIIYMSPSYPSPQLETATPNYINQLTISPSSQYNNFKIFFNSDESTNTLNKHTDTSLVISYMLIYTVVRRTPHKIIIY